MFQALSNALSGLYAQKAAMDVISQNIANVNTQGYSRQRVNMEAVGSSTKPAWLAKTLPVGLGVQITSVERLTDAFLTVRSRLEHSSSGYLDQMQSTYSDLEGVYGEPSDGGLQAQLANFWSAWDDVSNNPTDPSARAQLVETTNTLTDSFNRVSSDLTTLSDAYVNTLRGKVDNFNSYAQQVAALNDAIFSAGVTGQQPNNLLDQRDLLLQKMSDLGQIDVTHDDRGELNVFMNGACVVRGNTSTAVQVDTTTNPLVTTLRLDNDGDAMTTTDGPAITMTNGQFGALLESINTTLPGMQTDLDAIANNLITTVNTQHAAGYDLAGNGGADFFDHLATGAANIHIASTVAADPTLIAASNSTTGTFNGENARLMAQLASSLTGPDAGYRSLIGNLGIKSSAAQNRSTIQGNIKTQVDQSLQSAGGVSLDEEMASLVQYQHAYDAAAKMISVVDEALGTLIDSVH
jgi:flagellar hook-associated protein 1 FlgK